jgi:hypothetical protein
MSRKKSGGAVPRPPRRFDTTSCRRRVYEDVVHRDYLAHCLRWSWIDRHTTHDDRVLDIGCGRDFPLVKLYSFSNSRPKEYVGVDVGALPNPPHRGWATFHEHFDFLARGKELGRFDVIACLEVIEHMEVGDGFALLRGIRDALTDDGHCLLSTPVFNGSAAANHIHEYEAEELRDTILASGLKIKKRWGTFASMPDMKKVMTPEHRAVFEALSEFYSHDFMACTLAPLYPDAARNNAWLLTR